MKKFNIFFGMILVIIFLFCINSAFTGELTWQISKKDAFEKAKTEKKKILLFGGRGSCGNCRYMRTQVFETMKPPVKEMLEKNYVLWFLDVDRSKEWHPYAMGMGRFDLPLICVIDPESKKTYEERSSGRQDSPGFYSMLSKHVQK